MLHALQNTARQVHKVSSPVVPVLKQKCGGGWPTFAIMCKDAQHIYCWACSPPALWGLSPPHLLHHHQCQYSLFFWVSSLFASAIELSLMMRVLVMCTGVTLSCKPAVFLSLQCACPTASVQMKKKIIPAG